MPRSRCWINMSLRLVALLFSRAGLLQIENLVPLLLRRSQPTK